MMYDCAATIYLPMGDLLITTSGATSPGYASAVRGEIGVKMGPQMLKQKSVAFVTR